MIKPEYDKNIPSVPRTVRRLSCDSCTTLNLQHWLQFLQEVEAQLLTESMPRMKSGLPELHCTGNISWARDARIKSSPRELDLIIFLVTQESFNQTLSKVGGYLPHRFPLDFRIEHHTLSQFACWALSQVPDVLLPSYCTITWMLHETLPNLCSLRTFRFLQEN